MSPPAGQDPRVLRNRAAVHAAALETLAAQGASGLNVDRIAETSGVSRSTIYRHWPDMRALVVAAFDEVVHASSASLEPTGDVEADLSGYLHDYARRLNDPTYTAVTIAIVEWSWRDPEFAAEHSRTFDDARSRAASILRAGVRSGRLRADLDVRAAVEDIVAPFLYRRLVLRRTITSREVEALHCRLLDGFGA
jgi:AcrR family transcriptional regulator